MIKNISEFSEKELESGEGVSMAMLISNEVAPHFMMRKFRIKKGGSMPYHTNSVEHEQFVLKGKAKVVIDGKEYEAKEGDVLFIPAGAAHSYEVIGEEDYEFLCMVPDMEDRVEIVE